MNIQTISEKILKEKQIRLFLYKNFYRVKYLNGIRFPKAVKPAPGKISGDGKGEKPNRGYFPHFFCGLT